MVPWKREERKGETQPGDGFGGSNWRRRLMKSMPSGLS
jgi:hypothetical protein